jgi:hypothetical protein
MSLAACFAALALLAAVPMAAEGVRVIRLPPPGSRSWQAVRLPGVDRATDYETVELDGSRALRASSKCSASALVLRLEDVDLERTPRLRWRWRVDEEVATQEPRTRGGDDFAARVYVLFPFDAERASTWERMRRRILQIFYEEQAIPGHALSYVWCDALPKGTEWPNPYTSRSRMISLHSGPRESWLFQEVDVASDYVSLFEREPPQPTALGIMSDSDDSCGSATAWFADFEFRGP